MRVCMSIISGQRIIFHQPRFPWNKGIGLMKPPFGVRSCEVAIIWPDNMYFPWTKRQQISDSTLGKIASKEVLEGNSNLVWSELWSLHGLEFLPSSLSQIPKKKTARNTNFEKHSENHCFIEFYREVPVEAFCQKKLSPLCITVWTVCLVVWYSRPVMSAAHLLLTTIHHPEIFTKLKQNFDFCKKFPYPPGN